MIGKAHLLFLLTYFHKLTVYVKYFVKQAILVVVLPL